MKTNRNVKLDFQKSSVLCEDEGQDGRTIVGMNNFNQAGIAVFAKGQVTTLYEAESVVISGTIVHEEPFDDGLMIVHFKDVPNQGERLQNQLKKNRIPKGKFISLVMKARSNERFALKEDARKPYVKPTREATGNSR